MESITTNLNKWPLFFFSQIFEQQEQKITIKKKDQNHKNKQCLQKNHKPVKPNMENVKKEEW